MNRNDDNTTTSAWQALQAVMPDVASLGKDSHAEVLALVRRFLLREQQEASMAAQIYRLDHSAHIENLKYLAASLPFSSDIEKKQIIEELYVSPEEQETEYAHWAFRHQSTQGELLAGETLVKFKIIRINEFTYLLLCEKNLPEIAASFSKVFGRQPDCFSEKAFAATENNWAGWIWFLVPDSDLSEQMKAEITSLWKADKK